MAYATVADFVEKVTEAEARALARSGATYDEARISAELDNASAEIDSYLSAKYATPISPVPRTVQQAAIDLARATLDLQGRDHVKEAAARVRAWLKDVSRGLAVLAGGVAGVDKPADAPAASVLVAAPARVFTDDSLAAFTGRGR